MSSYYTYKGNSQLGMKYSEKAFEQARVNQDIELLAPISYYTKGGFLLSELTNDCLVYPDLFFGEMEK